MQKLPNTNWLPGSCDTEADLHRLWAAAVSLLPLVETGFPSTEELQAASTQLRHQDAQHGEHTSRRHNDISRGLLGLRLLSIILAERLNIDGTHSGPALISGPFNPLLWMLAETLSPGRQSPLFIFNAPPTENAEAVTESASPTLHHQLSQANQLSKVIFTGCDQKQAKEVHANVPTAHTLSCSSEKLSDLLATIPGQHWLTIVIPVLSGDEENRALDSIARQNSSGVTTFLIYADQSNCYSGLIPTHKECALDDGTKTVIALPAFDRSPYDAMNLGLKLAKTPWIYFLGCDDELYADDTLATLKRYLDDNAVMDQLLYGNVEIQGDGHGTYDRQIYGYEFDYQRLRHQTPCHQGILYPVEALRAAGGYSLNYPVCADWEANVRLWNKTTPVFIDTVVAKFARGGISSTIRDTMFFEDLPSLWLRHMTTTKPKTDS